MTCTTTYFLKYPFCVYGRNCIGLKTIISAFNTHLMIYYFQEIYFNISISKKHFFIFVFKKHILTFLLMNYFLYFFF